jgi:type IV secretion system protein TrbF
MLGRWFRRTTNEKEKPDKRRGAPPSPYLKARSNFESLFRNQAKEKHAWKFVALGELVLLGTLLAAYIHLASTSRIVPYVVEVDQLGQAVAFGPAEPLRRSDQRVLIRDLSALIRNLRSVTADPQLQVHMIQDAYAFLDDAAVAFLNEYFADPEHNPHRLARELTRSVQVTSVLPIPNSDSWRVQWTETEHPRGGRISQRRAWEAYLTVDQVPPERVEVIQKNPLGVYVTGINWTPITQLQPEPGL